ncbi:MerR family DNA-binding transcriptional regulator [Paenibacillus sp. J5C_2022]|uniref:MerR family DNA-binding transcriptional regulator n=1 Tax=Paenibacillus sp. J5C2022 TaxID=2977129 RepID=UPI0021D0A936|nr:MerR family DNA-binding transcriptional regulator [Paenibacillus sp. J5C2022]MCU6707383.1 MerR family DNA-binding transcriptional regulator [Paenibacillus sp. J5C2022]
MYTPKEMAELIQVSTTTLRRYEEQDLIPDVVRTASNRRCYTAVHLQAFVTVRALLKGCDIPIAYEIMRTLKRGSAAEAMWLMNEQLHKAQLEKQRVESIMAMIAGADFSDFRIVKNADAAMTIGEVSKYAGVNASAIRHWEKEGLIQSFRNANNGYRQFSIREVRKIMVISSLRKTVHFIEHMKQLLHDLDTKSLESVGKSFHLAMQKLHDRLALQYRGIAEIMRYMEIMNMRLP